MKYLAVFLFSFILFAASAQPTIDTILPLKERAAKQEELLGERLKNLLPALMRQQGIDMWVIAAREYNEDPIIKTIAASYLAFGTQTYHSGNV